MQKYLSKFNSSPLAWTVLFSIVYFGVVIGGGPSYQSVVDDIRGETPEIRERAIFFLTQIKRNDQAYLMEHALYDENRGVRKSAIRALEKMRNPHTLDAMTAALERDPELAPEYLKVLAELKNPSALPIIERYVDHENEEVREAALEGVEAYSDWIDPWETIDSEGNEHGSRDEIIPDYDQLSALIREGRSQ